jgi:hypothetical protein
VNVFAITNFPLCALNGYSAIAIACRLRKHARDTMGLKAEMAAVGWTVIALGCIMVGAGFTVGIGDTWLVSQCIAFWFIWCETTCRFSVLPPVPLLASSLLHNDTGWLMMTVWPLYLARKHRLRQEALANTVQKVVSFAEFLNIPEVRFLVVLVLDL